MYPRTRIGLLSIILFFQVSHIVMAEYDVNWPALNPAFGDAYFIKDSTVCLKCHEDEEALKYYGNTPHAKAFKDDKLLEGGGCESCHGPASKHIEDRRNKKFILKPQGQSSICLQCHEGGSRKYWKGSAHASSDVGCTGCHSVMQNRNSIEGKGERGLLSATSEDEVCYTCHGEVRGQMNKPSHHPVREGKMTCSGCHLPHGSINRSLLKGASVNEMCFGCHQEKRGPFLWEHAPVRESCLTCHDVHGSNNRNLLNTKDSFLCLQCHSYGGHVNLPRYNRVSNPYGEGCVNCHIATHGSNSPSGPKLTR